MYDRGARCVLSLPVGLSTADRLLKTGALEERRRLASICQSDLVPRLAAAGRSAVFSMNMLKTVYSNLGYNVVPLMAAACRQSRLCTQGYCTRFVACSC